LRILNFETILSYNVTTAKIWRSTGQEMTSLAVALERKLLITLPSSAF